MALKISCAVVTAVDEVLLYKEVAVRETLGWLLPQPLRKPEGLAALPAGNLDGRRSLRVGQFQCRHDVGVASEDDSDVEVLSESPVDETNSEGNIDALLSGSEERGVVLVELVAEVSASDGYAIVLCPCSSLYVVGAGRLRLVRGYWASSKHVDLRQLTWKLTLGHDPFRELHRVYDRVVLPGAVARVEAMPYAVDVLVVEEDRNFLH